MRPAAGVLLALSALILLSGCVQTVALDTNVHSVALDTHRGVPDGYDEPLDLLNPEPFAVWLDDGERFAVITFGSSSCPPVPTTMKTTDAATIALTFVRSPNAECTADLGPTTHEFATPEAIDAGGTTTIDVLFDDEPDYEFPLEIEGNR